MHESVGPMYVGAWVSGANVDGCMGWWGQCTWVHGLVGPMYVGAWVGGTNVDGCMGWWGQCR